VDDLGKIQEPAKAAIREELANLKNEMRKGEEEKEAVSKVDYHPVSHTTQASNLPFHLPQND
jgi:hypothetical protein